MSKYIPQFYMNVTTYTYSFMFWTQGLGNLY